MSEKVKMDEKVNMEEKAKIRRMVEKASRDVLRLNSRIVEAIARAVYEEIERDRQMRKERESANRRGSIFDQVIQ